MGLDIENKLRLILGFSEALKNQNKGMMSLSKQFLERIFAKRKVLAALGKV